jgi:hypothetical protein
VGKGGPPAGPLASWSNSRPRHRWRSSGFQRIAIWSGPRRLPPMRPSYCGEASAPVRGSAHSGTVQAVANEDCGQRRHRHSGIAMRWPPERVLRPAGMARGRPRYRDYGWPAPLGRTKKTLPPAPATRGKKTKSGMGRFRRMLAGSGVCARHDAGPAAVVAAASGVKCTRRCTRNCLADSARSFSDS